MSDTRPAESRPPASTAEKPETPPQAPLTWEYSGPFLTDPVIRFHILMTAGMIEGLWAVLGLLIWWQGDARQALALFTLASVVTLVLFLTIGLIGLLMTWNRFQATFRLDEQGASMRTGTLRERAMTKTIAIIGVLARNPIMAGTALGAQASYDQFIAWRDVLGVVVHRKHRVISLWNSWHPVVRLWCPPEIFEEVVARVLEAAARGAQDRLLHPAESPGARLCRLLLNVFWLGGAVAGGLAIFGLDWLDFSQEDREMVTHFALTVACFVWMAGMFPGLVGRGLAVLTALGSLLLTLAVHAEQQGEFTVPLAGCLLLLGMSVWRMLRREPIFRPWPEEPTP